MRLSGKSGRRGWGAILISGVHRKEINGGEAHTTNNRMSCWPRSRHWRLEAALRHRSHTDSEYVRKTASSKWIFGWKKKGWRTADNKPVKNAELWQQLDTARLRHEIRWHWVKGHAGHPENERADELAREGMAPFLKRR